jgi:hypothetical protein
MQTIPRLAIYIDPATHHFLQIVCLLMTRHG